MKSRRVTTYELKGVPGQILQRAARRHSRAGIRKIIDHALLKTYGPRYPKLLAGLSAEERTRLGLVA